MIPPDSSQRAEALDPTRSFIVEAPAGSGKTSLLVQRYLRLLSLVERPEAVVAMTFTRKAAAEMRDRVIKALERPQIAADATGYDRQTAALVASVIEQDQSRSWNLRDDPSRLQIQTIDSLCSMLTRRMPVLSHLGGAPKVRETPDELYRLAARRTIGLLAEGSETERAIFRYVALHFDNNLGALEKQIAKMLAKREQWSVLKEQSHETDVQIFCDLLHHAEGSLMEIFREAGEVDFTEITRAAIAALGGPESPSDLLFWLDYRIQHLLVDEFQDTSRSQFNLVKALTGQWSDNDGRTLFLVGDPMQSIYRFREAEVGFFLNCWHDQQLGSVRLTPIRLTANFRSTPQIVEWTQQTFQNIFDQDSIPQASVGLRPASAIRQEFGLRPEVISFVDDKGDAEAARVVELTRKLFKQGEVAILVRSRNHLFRILPALRDAGIRYEAVEIDQLCEEQHVLDVISLTRAILHVGDRLSWLACLRAPWCGLSLNELAAIAEGDQQATVLERIALVPRAVPVAELLQAAVHQAGRRPLRELVEQTWMALGGPAALREASHLEDVQTYLDLLEEVERGGIVRDFSLLDERLEYLFAKPVSAGARVKIMTIHGAKGLEFDTVIVPQLHKGARPNERDLLIWSERVDEHQRTYLKAAIQPQRKGNDLAYDEIKEELDVREQNELKRLFYVAATRAKDRLYLLGCAQTNKKKTELCTPSSGTFLRLIWDVVKPQFDSEFHRNRTLTQLRFEPERANIVRHLPQTWRAPQFDYSIIWQPDLRRAIASGSKVVNYEWVSGTGRHTGTVIHDALKRMSATGLWSPEQILRMRDAFAAELRRLGVGASELREASGRVVRALTNAVASERGRWILAARDDSRVEWSLNGVVQGQLVSGIVDRTFRDELGRRWIVDYKTSEHEGADVELFLQRQFEQYRKQLETYAVLVSHMTADPIHLGLYFPLLDQWREWQYFEEIAAPAV